MIKRIDNIEITNVRGIAQANFKVELFPNKPTLIVAPNGFGKSSMTAAFASLNSKRLELHKDNSHKGNENLAPSLKLSYTMMDGSKNEKEANSKKNEMAAVFDIHVINSQLISKVKKLKISGAMVATSAIEVLPVVLIKTIPPVAKFAYSYSTAKNDYGKNGKILPNISALLTDDALMAKIGAEADFSKQGQVGFAKALATFKEKINAGTGTVEALLASVSQADRQAVLSVPYIRGIFDAIKGSKTTFTTDVEYFLSALQISDVHAKDKTAFKKAVEYASYNVEKSAYIQMFSSLKGTWKNIGPKETKEGLIVEFPKANQISNGERDIICFVAQLKKAKLKFKKNKCILVIDEIFDYLDDANLVACQYYMTEMIRGMKAEGRQIFPLIMTHLNPGVFRNFTFSDQKVCYLNKSSATDRGVEKIIIKRVEKSIEEPVSKYFLHFHPEDKDLSAEFQALGLPAALAKSSRFAEHCKKHLEQYLEGKTYDPLAVCCDVRRRIEERAYDMLNAGDQIQFLSTHKTTPKLEFMQSKGIDVPEVYFLLGVVYNDALHLRENQDNFSALGSKLENLTIKHMISGL
ncbi:hypothetical protein [Paraburkholderia sp. 32]|uniref:hypothetical protein n=1 Tax=Paraburkholderia sp. 32 TaxID=2991057 RepID=UPI003D1EE87E